MLNDMNNNLHLAGLAFDELLGSDEFWVLSLIDPSGLKKTDFIMSLIETRCKNIPYASYSLDTYVGDIGGLFSALIESPSIRNLIPDDVFASYQGETANALADLSSKPLSIARNEITAPATDSEQSQQINIEADGSEIVQSMEHLSDRYSDRRIAHVWLYTVSKLSLQKNPPQIVFFFDEYDVFEDQTSPQDYNFFWGILERAHNNQIPGLCVVLASRKALYLTNSLKNSRKARACAL
jgi:hypothetical protein